MIGSLLWFLLVTLAWALFWRFILSVGLIVLGGMLFAGTPAAPESFCAVASEPLYEAGSGRLSALLANAIWIAVVLAVLWYAWQNKAYWPVWWTRFKAFSAMARSVFARILVRVGAWIDRQALTAESVRLVEKESIAVAVAKVKGIQRGAGLVSQSNSVAQSGGG